uniref:Putative helicase n=1 Tax=viral metagenome TaxID=1070528 RepID=A0A6M3XWL7_9ZZZZ
MRENKMTLEEAKGQLSKYRDLPFRPFQKEAVEYILDSEKKFIFLEAPTGSGKSLVAMVSGVAMGGVIYSIHSKLLQNQVVSDFPSVKSLFGRSNYPCIEVPGFTCDECFHSKFIPCQSKKDCLYDIAKEATLSSQLKILNHSYLLFESNYVGQFSKSDFNIIDEADNLEGTLIDFVTLTFTAYSLGRLGIGAYAKKLRQTSKDPEGLLNEWQCFASTAKIRAQSIIGKLTQESNNAVDLFGEVSDKAQKALKERTRVQRLLNKIQLFQDNVDETWVLDADQEDRFIFRPLWLNEALAAQFLWNHAKKWCLMSATFLPFHLECRRLGIPIEDAEYKCLPSTFPIENRRVNIWPAANLVYKEMAIEVPKLIYKVKKILSIHPNERGIIHGVSYRLSQEVYDRVNDKRLLIHGSSNRQEVIDEFLESKENAVIISPSLERGISLDYDKARFVIVLKMPWLNLKDKIVSRRVYSSKFGNEWFMATAMMTVLQMCGRACRDVDDTAISYILDEQFKKALLKRPTFLPEWFRAAIEFE